MSISQLILLSVTVMWLWPVLALVFLGVGAHFIPLLGTQKATPRGIINLTWLGWATSLGLLQLLHLGYPINVGIQCLLAVTAVAGLVRYRGYLAPQDIRLGFSWRLLLLLACLLPLAVFAASPDWYYDSQLYHQQNVIWASRYPVVPGLGNLHVRLAFNSSLHLYFALLDAGWLRGLAPHVGNSFLFALTFATLLTGRTMLERLTGYLLIPGVLALAFPLYLASFINDPAANLCQVMVCVLLLRLTQTGRSEEAVEDFALLLALAVIGVTIKLSVLPLATAAALTGLFLSLRKRLVKVSRAKVMVFVSALTCVAAAWLAHSAIQSGYLLFPLPHFPLPVDWRVPQQTVIDLNGWIRSWARANCCGMDIPYQQVLASYAWLKPWLAENGRSVWGAMIPLALVLCGLTVWVVAGCRKIKLRVRQVAPVLLVLALSLAAWFVSVPALRFAWALIWMLMALVSATFLSSLRQEWRQRAGTAVACVSLLLLVKSAHSSLKWQLAHRMLDEQAGVEQYRTASGLALVVPQAGELCFAAALPCTPYPHPALRMRRPGDLSNGFKLEPFSESATVGWYTSATEPARAPRTLP